jgi:hypothetical protein
VRFLLLLRGVVEESLRSLISEQAAEPSSSLWTSEGGNSSSVSGSRKRTDKSRRGVYSDTGLGREVRRIGVTVVIEGTFS